MNLEYLALSVVSTAIATLAIIPSTYLGLLALLGREQKMQTATHKKFMFVVPSHNEELGIAKTVKNLLSVDYPKESFGVFVIADNCGDTTASMARNAGATVWERNHATKKGKGYALEFAFSKILNGRPDIDAVVVVDADTQVSPNILEVFSGRLHLGEHALQAYYGVSNPRASWRTQLMSVALGMFHGCRSGGRERLGLSVGLRGNGMCFSKEVLKRFPHRAYGLVEDVEYGITLGLGNVRVAFDSRAKVFGEMVSGGAASESQRKRWEGGRSKLLREKVPLLFKESLHRNSATILDLMIDLIIPPLSYLGLLVVVGLALESWGIFWFGHTTIAAPLWFATIAALLSYLIRGIIYSELSFLEGLKALAFAPFYVIWKIFKVRPASSKDTAWVRTKREGE